MTVAAPRSPIPSPIDKRLLFVTGKGGAGKTTVSAAIGLAAARRGKRTIICEVGQQQRLPGFFQRRGIGSEETELAPNLYALSIDPERALEEYLHRQLGSRALSSLLAHSRVFHYIAVATPGLRELVTVGALWELAQPERRAQGSRYDLVIADAPATGHGLGLLRSPKTFVDIARIGPIRGHAEQIHSFIVDPAQTGMVLACLAEELSVNETIELRDHLLTELGLVVDAVVANAVQMSRFSAREAKQLALAQRDATASAAIATVVATALREHASAVGQRAQLRRLKREFPGVVAVLPFLFDPELELDSLEGLARDLEQSL